MSLIHILYTSRGNISLQAGWLDNGRKDCLSALRQIAELQEIQFNQQAGPHAGLKPFTQSSPFYLSWWGLYLAWLSPEKFASAPAGPGALGQSAGLPCSGRLPAQLLA